MTGFRYVGDGASLYTFGVDGHLTARDRVTFASAGVWSTSGLDGTIHMLPTEEGIVIHDYTHITRVQTQP